MIACTDGHLFCRDCAKRAIEEAVGNRKPELKCIAAAMTTSTSSDRGMCSGKFLLKEVS